MRLSKASGLCIGKDSNSNSIKFSQRHLSSPLSSASVAHTECWRLKRLSLRTNRLVTVDQGGGFSQAIRLPYEGPQSLSKTDNISTLIRVVGDH